ncbi:hypothetical protein CVN68_18520 [Sphingomonas psychrotolerans]|uniref:Uncharacterized protein n=1 Tax=Sphingomonas psychrotolerans TaxID=1327635 RepID=A0A2K8ML21_9SPHN|nr:hypothetical protein CVN68_18520 [Sphingomonas psychrotolerans]
MTGCVAHGATKPIDVLSAFSANDGQRIEVRGFLRYGDDARGVWQSQASYRDYTPEAAPACITLWNAGAFREQLLRRDGSTITITGKVRVEPPLHAGEISLGRCSDVGLVIERLR